MVNLDFKKNFNGEFKEGQLISCRLNKTVWNIISLIIGAILWIICPILGLLWTVITVVVNLVWANYDRVHMNAEMRKKRARLAAMMNDLSGQLINTRQSNDAIRIIYGICKTGGTWVFNKMSRANNQIMNTIITWGEGEISGLGTGIDNFPLFSGTTTLNDLHTQGEFVYAGCSCDFSCDGFSPCSCNMSCHVY